MKLTRERLKQIIREELEEARYDAMGFSKDIERNVGLEDEKPLSRPVSQPSMPKEKSLSQQIFDIKETDPKITPIINTVGNLISAIEQGQDTKHYLRRFKEELETMSKSQKVPPMQERKNK